MTQQDPDTAATISDLQRRLLHLCRNKRFFGGPGTQGEIGFNIVSVEASKLRLIHDLRKQIAALDPNAALYYGWAGPADEPPPEHQGQRFHDPSNLL